MSKHELLMKVNVAYRGGGAMGAAASPYRLAGEGKLNFTGKSERTQALTEESLARRPHMAPPQLDEICDAAHYLK